MENGTIVKTEQKIEVVDTITKSLLELDEVMLGYFLAIIQFHQRVNKLFFGEEDYEEYNKEVENALKAFIKIKDDKLSKEDSDRVKKTIGKAIEKYGSIKGKPIVMEVAIKLAKRFSVKDISNWVFSINDLYSNTYEMYDWMY